jgi:hypothetical protein
MKPALERVLMGRRRTRYPYRGLFQTDALSDSILPFGTSAINTSAAAGTTSRTLSVDSAVTFNGKPTTKLVIVGAGSSSEIEVGVSTASITLSAAAQQALSKHVFIALKTDGANTITDFVLYLGDSGYANYYTFVSGNPTTLDGWTVFEKTNAGATSTTGTPIALTLPQRAKLRLTTSSTVAAGTIWLAYCGVVPAPAPTVVFTCDDGYSTWVWLADQAKQRNVPISFGVISNTLGDASVLTAAEAVAIGNDPSGLFEITNHAADHVNLPTAGFAAYSASVDECRADLIALGLDPYAASLHQYVNGNTSTEMQDFLIAGGYHSARGVGASGHGAPNLLIGADAPYAMWNLPITCALSSAETLTTVKSYITTAAASGTAIIMGHNFLGAASANAWIAGYDDTYGVLNLLDWLASKRDNEGWRLMRWSDWAKRMALGDTELIRA